MIGLADRVSLPGERSDYYIFSDEGWEAILKIRLDRIESLREMAEDGMRGMQNQHPAWVRLEEITAWTEMVEKAYEGIIKTWQSRKESPV